VLRGPVRDRPSANLDQAPATKRSQRRSGALITAAGITSRSFRERRCNSTSTAFRASMGLPSLGSGRYQHRPGPVPRLPGPHNGTRAPLVHVAARLGLRRYPSERQKLRDRGDCLRDDERGEPNRVPRAFAAASASRVQMSEGEA
jgi:hypothetical protein